MLTAPQNPAERLVAVRESITVAARSAGRDPASITLIGVAKSQPIVRVTEALDAGLADIGENYIAGSALAFRRARRPIRRQAFHRRNADQQDARSRAAFRLGAHGGQAAHRRASLRAATGNAAAARGLHPGADWRRIDEIRRRAGGPRRARRQRCAPSAAEAPRPDVPAARGAGAGTPAPLVLRAAGPARGPERRRPRPGFTLDGDERRLCRGDRRGRDTSFESAPRSSASAFRIRKWPRSISSSIRS